MAPRTSSFVAEFPLVTSPEQERALTVRLEAARHVYNACLGESLRRLELVRQSRDWHRACTMKKSRTRTKLFQQAVGRHGFTATAIQKYAEGCRDRCWIGEHLGSHDTQTTSLRAFRAVQQYSLGKKGRPRFKGKNRLHSIEAKEDAVILFRREPVLAIHWRGLVMPLLLDPKDNRDWQSQALACRTKYVRILRREIKGRIRWFAQLIQEGTSPRIRETGEGVVGLDLGPSTIAAVSSGDAILEKFCPGVEQPWKELRRIERALERSRRATNRENYEERGCAKKGRRKWSQSHRYRELARKRRERERRLAAERKRAHGELANRILGQGVEIRTEQLSYRSLQKNYGRSVKVRGPGWFVSTLKRKAASAGGEVVELPTKLRLSQFDHSSGEYVKKPLNQRVHVFASRGMEPVQRDLYSALLAQCCSKDHLDIRQVEETWPAAEPLLRRAMAREKEPASGPGFALPCVLSNARVGRPSKRDADSCEAVDAVAQARAAESTNLGILRTPGL